jgi:hypothetical protein
MFAAQRELAQPWRQVVRRALEEVASRTPESVAVALPTTEGGVVIPFKTFTFQLEVLNRMVEVMVSPTGISYLRVDGGRTFPFGLWLGDLRRAAQTLQLNEFGIPVSQDETTETAEYIVDVLITQSGRHRAKFLAGIGRELALDPTADLSHDDRIDLFRSAPPLICQIPLRGGDLPSKKYDLWAEVALDHEKESRLSLMFPGKKKLVAPAVPFPYYYGMATNAARRIVAQLQDLAKRDRVMDGLGSLS